MPNRALLLALILTATTLPAAAQPAMRKDADGCSLLVPEGLGTGPFRWIGSCTGGTAEGPGVVRVQVAANDLRLFAGTMHAGKPVAGFLDEGPTVSQTDAVGPVLHFRDATPLPLKSMSESLQACRIAASGARTAADRFRAAGNTASAKFYIDWVISLQHCQEPE